MIRALALSALLCGFVPPAIACSYIPDERSRAERLDDEPIILVGKVVAILDEDGMDAMQLGECGPDVEKSLALGNSSTCVVMRVEQTIRGYDFKTIEVPQGSGADCAIEYSVGQYWLYAGNFIGGPSEELRGRLSRRELRRMRDAYGD